MPRSDPKQTLLRNPSWVTKVERGPKRLGPHPDSWPCCRITWKLSACNLLQPLMQINMQWFWQSFEGHNCSVHSLVHRLPSSVTLTHDANNSSLRIDLQSPASIDLTGNNYPYCVILHAHMRYIATETLALCTAHSCVHSTTLYCTKQILNIPWSRSVTMNNNYISVNSMLGSA